MAEYIQIPGKHNIWIGFPGAQNALYKLGTSLEDNEVVVEKMYHDVHSDRHGGQQGPPIEKQFLGMMGRGQLRLSVWDPEITIQLEREGGLFASAGTVPDTAVGALVLRDRSFRLIFEATRDSTKSRNFVCVLFSNFRVIAGGTKYAMATFDFEAHRAPPGHAKANIMYDADLTGNYTGG